jgi:PAS domain S-box-containing protein
MAEVLRLFLIEDDDNIGYLMRKSLEKAGHQVTRCRTAADALIVLGHNTFDLALLDHRLPDMSGLELLQMLAHESISVPILMVTAFGDEHLVARVLKAGALDYIAKDPGLHFLDELPKRVRESVSKHRLEQLNRLLIQSMESARDGIMITDLQGTILHVNQALENLTGYSRSELLGQNPRLFKSGLHPVEVYSTIWRSILARQSWQGELTNRRKNGTLFDASLTISPIVDPQGRLTHFVGIMRNITEYKQLQQQLLQAQKMQSVGTLAGGVAHEFNNLLAGINGYAALGLREPDLTPTLKEFMQCIVDLSERAAILTRQLLAFARKPALTRRPTPIPDLVRATADLVVRSLHQDVQVEARNADQFGMPFIVEADANQLQQALINLALNARDAIRSRNEGNGECGAGRVESGGETGTSHADNAIIFRLREAILTGEVITFPHKVPPGSYVLLEVEDRGCGMTAEVLQQAIDPFFTTKEVGQGTGLGLPMVFGIVQGHGGYLSITSRPNQGTCVGMYLPRLTEAPHSSQFFPIDDGHDLEPETTPGCSILVIDDEEAVLDVISRFLQLAGHTTHAVMSGQEAWRLLEQEQPPAVDLVILDLMIPREDSLNTFRRFRQRYPTLPVLLCTGLVREGAAAELLTAGASGLLRKPFRMTELWYAVKQALQRDEAAHERGE